jgi:outer membrane protein OmpA-like peptidoglycan-associated protein
MGGKGLGGVQFQPGTAQFAVDSYAEMDKLLQYLTENPERVVAIQGHTGRSDAQNANQQLSDSRIRAVVDYLQVQGIRPERILSAQQQEKYELSFAGILNVEETVKAIVFYAQ